MNSNMTKNLIKVGIFISGEPTGGGKFQYCLAMLEALSERNGVNFDITGAAESKLWKNLFDRYGVKSVYTPTAGWTDRWRRFTRFMHFPLSLRRFLAPWLDAQARSLIQLKCDLWIFPSHDDVSVEIPVKSVIAVHDLMHRYESRFPEVAGDGQYEVRETFFKSVHKTAHRVLVNSKVCLDQVEESYGPLFERGEVLPYIPYTHPPSSVALPPLALPKKFIFYPAQFWKHKNHENLILAIAQLKQKDGIEVHAVFAGSKKNSYEDCLGLIKKFDLENQMHFLGYVDETQMPELYRRANALIMPTFIGALTIPQIEAFVYECPVAVSRIYGIPDQVGDAALLFDPSSVEEIAAAVKSFWTDEALRCEMKKRGLKRAAAWGKPQFTEKLTKILNSVHTSS